jgi:ubiquinone/menaquinone biosynthesis C-methylase UbiE
VTDAPPTPGQLKTLIAGVFDRAAATYDSVGVDYFGVIARRLVELAGVREAEYVLDVGCGRGAAAFAAAEAVGPHGRVVATDLAPLMVTLTGDEARERGLDQVTAQLGDAEAPDFGDAEFDVVLASLVVFFLPDPAAALGRYRRLLRAGGRLALATFPEQPDGPWSEVAGLLQSRLPGGKAPNRPGDAGPLASPESLAAALRDAGFAASESRTEPFETTFASLDQWWTWAWSQGQRAALERVPADELNAFRAECESRLAPLVREDGSVPLTQYVTYTVATA